MDGVTYEFDLGGLPPIGPTPVPINADDSAEEVAAAVIAALQGNGVNVESVGNRINLPNLALGDVTLLGDGLVQNGEPGVTGLNRIVPVTLEMTRDEVAAQVRTALEDEFAGGDIDGWQNVKIHRETVKLFGHVVTDPGPLRVAASQIWDQFGAFNTSGPPQVTQYPGALRNMETPTKVCMSTT